MFSATFEYLFRLVAPELERRHNRGRPTISARKQLLIALWYMGTPNSYRSVCKTFDVGHVTAVRAVRCVCHALHSLTPHFITWPRGDKVDTTVADFRRKSPFPGVIGAIDGCHIVINAPKSSDGAYINRKGTHYPVPACV
ncbi:unnamed protein product [Lasius platythorax]|uniref:Nuclease HARBI1 n=1 Tax=Lasius platythorax TaxID=488582 RepID=A0AAV2MYS9_9HYME